jgi:twitching motility protein PilT
MHSASCAEALSRLCMSFPAEIQGSIRAQLADCIVGVSCQRLDFLPAYRLRVPRCELLLPSSGVRGAIRSGNLSQLSNMLQAGGEEGMWTFDRYQRWMEQVSDWVQPAATSTVAPAPAPAAGEGLRASSPKPPLTELPRAGSLTRGKTAPQRAPIGRTPVTSPADEVIEIPAEEMDLAQLAELAKKVIEPGTK